MIKTLSLQRLGALVLAGLMCACVHTGQRPDYAAFRKSQPLVILVLPPINDTTDVGAVHGMLSQMTEPLAEAGYYVVPVAVMEETFRQNGLTRADDIANVPAAKLREIFGADAALYSTVKQYGSVFRVLDSTTVVSASAKLVDLKTGDVLWQGTGRATGKEVGFNLGLDGLPVVGMLVQAATKQVAHSLSDEAHDVAGLASQRLLQAGPPNGLLYGPHSPKYGTN